MPEDEQLVKEILAGSQAAMDCCINMDPCNFISRSDREQ
jgi:hypothetical protein